MSIWEGIGVWIGHRLGAVILFGAPSLRPGVEWTVAKR